MKSQNYKILEATSGNDVETPSAKQSHLEMVTQDWIHMNFEYLWESRHICSRQSVRVLHHSHGNDFQVQKHSPMQKWQHTVSYKEIEMFRKKTTEKLKLKIQVDSQVNHHKNTLLILLHIYLCVLTFHWWYFQLKVSVSVYFLWQEYEDNSTCSHSIPPYPLIKS